MAWTDAIEDELIRLRWDHAWLKMKVALLKAEIALKAYNPHQPRAPAGGPNGGQWTNQDGRLPPASGDKEDDTGRRKRNVQTAFLAPYLIEEYNMGPRTICTYQGWPGRFAEIFPRGACPKKYLPGYGPIA